MIDKTTPIDATDSVATGSSTVQLVNPASIDNRDPVGDLAASQRVHQQNIIPTGVKQRNLTVQLVNSPEPGGEPFWFAFGPVVPGQSGTVTWTTISSTSGVELFPYSQMSFYFSTAPILDYPSFIQQGEHWPGPNFNMTNIICSFWADEGASDGDNVIAKQSLYNFSSVSVYAMATMRVRILANTTNLASN